MADQGSVDLKSPKASKSSKGLKGSKGTKGAKGPKGSKGSKASTTKTPAKKKKAKKPSTNSKENPSKPAKDPRGPIVRELFTTEETYVAGLHRLQEVYVKNIEDQSLLPPDVRRNLFGQIKILLGMNERLLADLKEKLESWGDDSCLSPLFLQFIPFMKIYSQYIENFDSSQETLARETESNKKLSSLLDQLMIEADGQSIGAHMILPVQRLPRYQLLLRELVKHTPEDHPDYAGLKKALDEIVAVVTQVNRQKAVADRRRKTIRKLATLDKSDSILVLHQHTHDTKSNLVGMIEVVVDSVALETSVKDRCYMSVTSPRETLKTKPQKMVDMQVIWKEELVFLVKDPDTFDLSSTSYLEFELRDLSSRKAKVTAAFKIPIIDIKHKIAKEELVSFDMYDPSDVSATLGTLKVSFAYVLDRMQSINISAVGSGSQINARGHRRSASITAGNSHIRGNGEEMGSSGENSVDDDTLYHHKRKEKKKKNHFVSLKRNVAKGGTIISRPLTLDSPKSTEKDGQVGIIQQLKVDIPEEKGSILDALSPGRGRKGSSRSTKSKSPRRSKEQKKRKEKSSEGDTL